jgi:outer membrane biosynthesis protein TonB
MASTNILRYWPVAPDRRLGMALIVSALLHALLMLSLSKYSVHGSMFTQPVHPPLRVRIEKLPESQHASPILIEKKKAVVHKETAATPPQAPSVPENVETSLPQPGVSVAETLYLRPIPSRANSALLETGEFRRSSELSEQPQTIRMQIPKYPLSAQQQGLSGWVLVLLLVDEHGKVLETAAADSSEAFGEFREDVAQEMRNSSFVPGKHDGQAVKTLVFAMVGFDSRALSRFDVPSSLTPPLTDQQEVH